MSLSDRNSPPPPPDLQAHVKGILGLGTLPLDGESRVTRGPFYQLFQGSEAAHEAMLELCMKLQAELEAADLSLEELTQEELIALMENL